jgi:hypothetical protein
VSFLVEVAEEDALISYNDFLAAFVLSEDGMS